MKNDIHERAGKAALVIQEKVATIPRVAVVLGSGLGGLADGLDDAVVVPYSEIPHFPLPTVAGHRGRLVVGSVGHVRVAALQGRFHTYEGFDLDAITFPIRVFQALGIRTLILTASTGGIRETLRSGDLVCLSDHLNLVGANPLRGPNDDRLGPRFPDMSAVYAPRLRMLAGEQAVRLGIPLTEGVYAAMPGPSYETPAEIRMLRTLGADVVGMSTVPEAIVACHAGMEVLALALVTNAAAGVTGVPITHEDVLEAGRSAGERLGGLLRAIIEKLGVPPEAEPAL